MMEGLVKSLLLCTVCLGCHAQYIGFNRFFSSNDLLYYNHPVKFDIPLPKWMNGTLIRTGTGKFEMGPRNVRHPFDSFAKLHSLKFQGTDEALFSTQFVDTGYYTDSLREGNVAPYMLFMQPTPNFTGFDNYEQLLQGSDNANVNIVRVNGDYLALGDLWRCYQINPSDLRTLGQVNPPIPGGSEGSEMFNMMATPHPMPEYGTTNLINYVMDLGPDYLHVIRYLDAQRRESIARIEVERASFQHSFAATKNYVIIFANPVFLNMDKIMETFEAVESIDFKADENTILYLVNIRTGQVSTLETEAFFGMHHVNAYETEDNKIIADIVTWPNTTIFGAANLENILDPEKHKYIPIEQARLRRFTIDLSEATVERTYFPETPGLEFINRLDFPVINENYRYEKYCYIYGVNVKADGERYEDFRLVKKDICGGGGDKVWNVTSHYMGEPVFIPKPGGTNEDEGYILNTILDGIRGESYVAIFDAETFEMVNKAYLPTYIPMGIHGHYFD